MTLRKQHVNHVILSVKIYFCDTFISINALISMHINTPCVSAHLSHYLRVQRAAAKYLLAHD
jgi:hypothetical protein